MYENANVKFDAALWLQQMAPNLWMAAIHC